jgi:serine/threonine protein kinase
MPRRARDNDLMQREADALSTLECDGEPRHRAYAPLLLDSFCQRDPSSGVQRVVNVLQHLDGFLSLAAVARIYPHGVHPRDAAWMWRRLLVALGYAHRAGVVHGAVVPEHVLINPGEHGLALVDWCYATRCGEPIAAMVGERRDLYPPEVAARRAAGPGTDIYLATKCMSWLIGEGAPPAMRRFAQGCTSANPQARPQDAWRLLAELDDLLHRLYGKRTFRPFTL